MKVTIEPTKEIFPVNGQPAKVWRGQTDDGIPVAMFVVACSTDTTDPGAIAKLREVFDHGKQPAVSDTPAEEPDPANPTGRGGRSLNDALHALLTEFSIHGLVVGVDSHDGSFLLQSATAADASPLVGTLRESISHLIDTGVLCLECGSLAIDHLESRKGEIKFVHPGSDTKN